ncbi:MAG: glycosyltransferase family 39 protein [Chloroflexi bacterium]|nr:glycosyltransferase family 39 protein [Chloroflexota bacterium]
MPPYVWDSLAIWGLKGKLIAASGELTSQAQAAWPFYPLNIPLQMTFLFLVGGDFVQIVFPTYFLSMLLLFYANLNHWVGTTLALACTLFLSLTPIVQYQGTIAYANLPFATYYIGSAIYLYKFLKENRILWLVLSGILIGVASWTRTESQLYLAINIIALLLFRNTSRDLLRHISTYVGIYTILWAPWTIFCKLAGYGDYFGNALGAFTSIVSGNLDQTLLAQIVSYAGARVQTVGVWGLLWIGLGIALLIGIKHLREHAPILVLLALNSIGLIYTYYSAGTSSTNPIEWWLYTGFDRMALHWAPLGIFYLGLTIEAAGLSKINPFPFRIQIDPYLILLILFSLFAIGPLLGPGYFWGAHDGRHSVYFLFEFDRVIQDGILYPRWLPDFTFGYGYPFFNIYGPGAFYVGEALHLLGIDFVTATKIVFALAILLSGPAMFAFVKRLTGSSQAAFLSGLAYVYIPYHIADIYVRAALAESVALIFLPLTLWGFYETVVNPNRKTIVATALAYGAMTFSHNGVALLFTPILGIWVLFLMIGELRRAQGNHVLRFIRLGLPSLAALLLGMGIVAMFLIPLALEYQFVRVDQWTANYYDYSNHFVNLSQLFNPTWGFGISYPGPNDGMSFQLGIMPVLLAVFSIVVILKNPNHTRRFWLFFLGMTVIVALLMFGFSLPIWEVLRLVTFAQFPWRLLTLTTVSLAVLAGAIALTPDAEEKSHGVSLSTLLLGVLIVLGSFPYLTAQMQLQAAEGPVGVLGLFRFQQSAGEMTGSTAWVKEIPTWSPLADVYFAGKKVKTKIDSTIYENPDDVWFGVDQAGKGLRADGERVFVDAKVDNLPVVFNTFYYPGWRAWLTTETDNQFVKELQITQVDDVAPTGRIKVYVPQGRYFLNLRFEDSPPRMVGWWISGASILTMLGIMIWDWRMRRMKDE